MPSIKLSGIITVMNKVNCCSYTSLTDLLCEVTTSIICIFSSFKKVLENAKPLQDIGREEGYQSSQHRFSKGKSCLTNLIAFHNITTGWVDVSRAVDIVYLDFSKAFNTISHSILVTKQKIQDI